MPGITTRGRRAIQEDSCCDPAARDWTQRAPPASTNQLGIVAAVTVIHFLNSEQLFVWGPDLKADLKLADDHFSALPEEEKARGLFLLASAPPETATIIASHWDRFLPGLRTQEKKPVEPRAKPAQEHDLVAQSNAFIEAAAARKIAELPHGDPEHLIIQRFIPKVRGKWRMFSKEVEEENDRERPH